MSQPDSHDPTWPPLARSGRRPILERDDLALALADRLGAGASVLLVGPAGVGKSRVALAAAQQASSLSLVQLELGAWREQAVDGDGDAWAQALADDLARLASEGKAVWAGDVPRLRRPLHGDGPTPWSVIRSAVAEHGLAVVAELQPGELEALGAEGLDGAFEVLAVPELGPASVDRVLAAEAAALGVAMSDGARRALQRLTSRWLPGRPQPGPSLDLLRQARHYQAEKASIDEHEEVDTAFVERVFSIYAGLPRSLVASGEALSTEALRRTFSDAVVGQPEAVDAVVSSLALLQAGVGDPSRPLSSLLFVGPPGVGRTTLTRALAEHLFGGQHRLVRVDLSDHAGEHGLATLVGTPDDPRGPAALVEAVRAQPFQVVQLDGLQAADAAQRALIGQLLDEGVVITPSGETVDFRGTVVVVTARLDDTPAVRLTPESPEEATARRTRWRTMLRNAVRPELLARFQHVVPFHPLGPAQVALLGRRLLDRLLDDEGVSSRNAVVEVSDEALSAVVAAGVDASWGAHGLARELRRRIVSPVTQALRECETVEGQVVVVDRQDGRVVVRLDTARAGRGARRTAPILRLVTPVQDRHDLKGRLHDLTVRLADIRRQADVDGHGLRRVELETAKRDPAFWHDPDAAARSLRDLDRSTEIVERVGRLDGRRRQLAAALADLPAEASDPDLTQRVLALSEDVAAATRELVNMGADGIHEALVEVRPLDRRGGLRDALVRWYLDWAEAHHREITWLFDPRHPHEPAWFAVRGRYAHGLLALEAGLHRAQDDGTSLSCRVSVAPWVERSALAVFGEHAALKAVGTFGGKVRSRLVCGPGVVLQNGGTLADNRDLASRVVGAWTARPQPLDAPVRRYDLSTPHAHDRLTGTVWGGPELADPARWQQLLADRVSHTGQGPEAA